MPHLQVINEQKLGVYVTEMSLGTLFTAPDVQSILYIRVLAYEIKGQYAYAISTDGKGYITDVEARGIPLELGTQLIYK